MIVDVTGIELIPGNSGLDCPGNRKHGECCCDECEYMMCCFTPHLLPPCRLCRDPDCPRAQKTKDFLQKPVGADR